MLEGLDHKRLSELLRLHDPFGLVEAEECFENSLLHKDEDGDGPSFSDLHYIQSSIFVGTIYRALEDWVESPGRATWTDFLFWCDNTLPDLAEDLRDLDYEYELVCDSLDQDPMFLIYYRTPEFAADLWQCLFNRPSQTLLFAERVEADAE